MTITEQHVGLKAEFSRMQSLVDQHQINNTAAWHHYQTVVAEYRAFVALFPALAEAA